ncbi:MAG: extracellular solute-binding protein, partial [Actinobacteria bacterium]|nr:extracellular solute-binding protein [Actinomycetota bacterium]
ALKKQKAWDPQKWYFTPDEYTLNLSDTPSDIQLTGIKGPQWGMPYQGNINGLIYNMTMMEKAGVPWPTEGKYGYLKEFLESLKKVTDASKEQYGIQMHSNGWIVWGTWARALQGSGNHMWRNADATKWDIFNDGGDKGYTLAIDTIHKYKVAPRIEDTKKLAGEIGDPFSAGKLMISWTGGGIGSQIVRIKDRFKWGLGPMAEGPRGSGPHHFTDQPHMVTNSAEKNKNVEASTTFVLFFADELVQGRIAIDRGSLPMVKSIIAGKEMAAPPPENHGTYYKKWMDQKGNHHWQNAHPAWWEWYAAFDASAKGFAGAETAEQSIRTVIKASDDVLAKTKKQYDEYKKWLGTLKF